jgi:3-oxoacid CoA-transferase subunit A
MSGTARGQGRAAALRFAAEGAIVVVGDLRHESALVTQRLVAQAGGTAVHDARRAGPGVAGRRGDRDDPAARRRRSPVRHPRELRQPRGDRHRGHARRPAGRRPSQADQRPPHPPRPHRAPEEVVNAAVFLASDEASCITGANLVVGGWLSVLPGRKETTSVNKVSTNADEAVADIPDGASLAVGGFGLSGIPEVVIRALHEQGATGLQVVSNNCGVDGRGLGVLLAAGRIARVTGSYVGENKEFARQYLSGELEVELVPQGTLAERLRAGGAGIPAFYTPAGVGTQVAKGGLPWRYAADGSVAVASPPKETRDYHGRPHVLEHAITTDFALVRAWRGDRHGNLVFRRAAANFNPLAAMAGRITIAEVEELVEPGELSPDAVHLPGVFVQRIVELTPAQAADKQIEKRTVRA